MKKNRNAYLDIVKAVAIILVVFGHCIKCGSGSEVLSTQSYFNDRIFIFITSFHMPLFMLISGYLFGYSAMKIDKDNGWIQLIIKKFKQLIIPLFCWSVVSLGVAVYKLIIEGGTSDLTLIWITNRIVSEFINGPWFLWAIWWCSLAVIIVRKFLKDSPFIYLFGFLLTFIIPDAYGLAYYKFMYPFFIMAYFFKKNKLDDILKKYYLNRFLIFFVIMIFCGTLFLYNYDTYIYTSGYTLLNKNIALQLYNDCLRFAVGFFGSLSIMYALIPLIKIFKDNAKRIMTHIGMNTLGIYLISGALNDDVLARLTASLHGINYFYTCIETLCMILLSLGINALLKKWKITNNLFLGGR